jgi:hypothetical protein
VATAEFRLIRLDTRYRRDLIAERTREKQRAEKLLESAALKLSSVISDLHGVTGRDIMDHLIAGERNPRALAQLARGTARRKISQLEEALEGAEFFIMDPAWGHMVIKMSGHPPRPAQVILNGHEYVAVAAQAEGIGFVKEGNCFTGIADPQGLARIAGHDGYTTRQAAYDLRKM